MSPGNGVIEGLEDQVNAQVHEFDPRELIPVHGGQGEGSVRSYTGVQGLRWPNPR